MTPGGAFRIDDFQSGEGLSLIILEEALPKRVQKCIDEFFFRGVHSDDWDPLEKSSAEELQDTDGYIAGADFVRWCLKRAKNVTSKTRDKLRGIGFAVDVINLRVKEKRAEALKRGELTRADTIR